MDYTELKELLEERIRVIADTEMRENDPDQQLALLQKVSEAIDLWRDQHRKETDRRLLHFLQNYSLSKALDFVSKEGSA